MATRNMERILFITCIFLISQSIVYAVSFPQNDKLREWSQNIGSDVKAYVKKVTGIDQLEQAYTNSNKGKVEWQKLNGNALVKEMAEKLGRDVFGHKTAALRESVNFAETLARDYNWDPNIKLNNVTYYKARDEKLEEKLNMRYSNTFHQIVNETVSSVHIPVEIYEGNKDILNGLRWSAGLEEIWIKNREKDPSLLWQYFGSQKGFIRTLPASKWQRQGVDLYDVRRRPWYTQGSSSPKDMMILIDTSGSVTGQALRLMKVAVQQLLETLGENDFVAVANFSNLISPVPKCFKTFVQASYRNKLKIKKEVETIEAKEMANLTKALDYAYTMFKNFSEMETRNVTVGANCNRIIMLLTDGSKEETEPTVEKWKAELDFKVRIFTYIIGRTADDAERVRELACNNRGYFAKIPAMGAIRTVVQEHVEVIARPLALNHYPNKQWSNIYLDAMEHQWTQVDNYAQQNVDKTVVYSSSYMDRLGLGMMTTLTMPVYNKSAGATNQTMVGVMGIDVTTEEMDKATPYNKISPRGYSFAINRNGYIVFHPNLKAQKGYLQDPPNVDFLEVEVENNDKIGIRRAMIDGENSAKETETLVVSPNQRYITRENLTYYYTLIPNSTFSLGIVVPTKSKKFPSISQLNKEDILKTVVNKTTVFAAPWDICSAPPKCEMVYPPNATENGTCVPIETTPLQDMLDENATCPDEGMVQHVLWDITNTEGMEDYWSTLSAADSAYLEGVFVSTNGGIVRIVKTHENHTVDLDLNLRSAEHYTRAMDHTDLLIFSVPYRKSENPDVNVTAPSVRVVKAATITTDSNDKYNPAVVGAQVSGEWLQSLMAKISEGKCDLGGEDLGCFLLDDGGFIIASNQEQTNVGRFFGDTDPVLMTSLFNYSKIYEQAEQYDFQGVCIPKEEDSFSSAGNSMFMNNLPLYDMLTINWWTTGVAWMFTNLNIYQWLWASSKDYVYAYDEETHENTNFSCIQKLAQYQFKDKKVTGVRQKKCEPPIVNPGLQCITHYNAARVQGTNLLLLVLDVHEMDVDCDCSYALPPQAPVQTEPNDPDMCITHQNPRYRKRPEACYDDDKNEDTSLCGASSVYSTSTLILSLVTVIMACLLSILER